MNNEIVSAILLGIISVTSSTVIIYWHVATKGTWNEWPAGRSLMGLLSIIAIGFGFGVVNRMLGSYPARYAVAILLYTLFVGALIFIGFTIRRELVRGKAKLKHPAAHPAPQTGAIDITVATDKDISDE